MKLNKYKNLVEAIEDMKITIKEFQEKNLTHTKIYKGYVESVKEWIELLGELGEAYFYDIQDFKDDPTGEEPPKTIEEFAQKVLSDEWDY